MLKISMHAIGHEFSMYLSAIPYNTLEITHQSLRRSIPYTPEWSERSYPRGQTGGKCVS